MNTQDDHIDALIASYLTGEASDEQIAFVNEWKARSEENRRHFEQFALIFQSAASSMPPGAFDTDAAWSKLKGKLSSGKTVPFRPSSGWTLLRFAAVITLFITVAVFVHRFSKSPDPEAVRLASQETMLADTLADGSGIYLNRQTVVEYAYDAEENKVTAELVGEAYFDINHDDEKIFIVEAEGTFIKDIGTAFNVQAYHDANTVEVFVEEGEVVFYTADNAGISLKANARGVYDKTTKTFSVVNAEPNITSYKSKQFTFSGQSLEQVVRKLNEVYTTRIEIGENLKHCRITVSFNDETIDEIAGIIAETLELTLSKSQNIITLKGEGCGAQ